MQLTPYADPSAARTGLRLSVYIAAIFGVCTIATILAADSDGTTVFAMGPLLVAQGMTLAANARRTAAVRRIVGLDVSIAAMRKVHQYSASGALAPDVELQRALFATGALRIARGEPILFSVVGALLLALTGSSAYALESAWGYAAFVVATVAGVWFLAGTLKVKSGMTATAILLGGK